VAISGDDNLARLAQAFTVLIPDSLALFEAAPGEDEACATGLLRVRSHELRDDWLGFVSGRLDELGLGSAVQAAQVSGSGRTGGRAGRHTSDFSDGVWADMTLMHREFPGARW
jgi:1,2-phenylacetyl-CoA epoxidase catalytic subunit